MQKMAASITCLVIGILVSAAYPRACHADEAPVIRPIYTPFPGVLFVPNDGKPHPGILLLHGSEGGLNSPMKLFAQAFAAQGYAAFAFCYAGCRTGTDADTYRPNHETINVDLEQTRAALQWLASSEYVGSKKVAVYGWSRGAEQALLLASLMSGNAGFRQPDAVAVHAPSDVVVGGWNWYWQDSVCLGASGGWAAPCGAPPPPDDAHWPVAWLWPTAAARVAPGNRIEVERIVAPVLITHGELDRVWSVDRTKNIKKSLEDAGRRPEVHIFPGEGHGFSLDADYQRTIYLLTFFKNVLN